MSLPALVALCLVITVTLPGFAFYVTRRSTRANVISERIRIFQNQWRSPILNEDAVAQRLMNVILAPAVKRKLRLAITVELDFGRRVLEENSIVVTVEAEYDFINVGRKEVIFSIDPSRSTDDSDADRRLAAFYVDNAAVPLSGEEQTIQVPVGTQRAIRTTSKYHGGYPYVATFPQSVPVLGDAEVNVTSFVGQPIRLSVIGRDDQNYRAQGRPATGEAVTLTMSIPGPLLPGDTVMLTVGI
jgi:hypothetical protein